MPSRITATSNRRGSPSSEIVVSSARDTCRVAYDEELANRIRECLQSESRMSEKRMFGGLAFLINGHIAVSASRQGGVLLRVDPVETEALLLEPHVAPFVMRGRELDGWLRIDAAGLETDEQLQRWVDRGAGYARSLPRK
jgi:TfoX N-terminal domain